MKIGAENYMWWIERGTEVVTSKMKLFLKWLQSEIHYFYYIFQFPGFLASGFHSCIVVYIAVVLPWIKDVLLRGLYFSPLELPASSHFNSHFDYMKLHSQRL